MTNILWLRRDLKLHDNMSLHRALREPSNIQPVFIFDKKILARFPNKKDRRISFIANALEILNTQLSGNLLVLHGDPLELIPALAKKLGGKVFAGEDYEPSAIARDKEVAKDAELVLSKQNVILSPKEVLKDDGTPYKVFTPYSRAWAAKLHEPDFLEVQNNFSGRIANSGTAPKTAKQMVEEIGYEYVDDPEWQPKNADKILKEFAKNKANNYGNTRDFPAVDGTSKISPYLRFGLITARECYNAVQDKKWIAEIIWREFYAMILYHYPSTVREEFQPQYRGLKWGSDSQNLESWKQGKTGYPIVDAGMRQLLQTGWMHNRVRMIVASFLTKDLLIDWRLGEEHFAQHLMDYDQASNVGGWQWAASTGTDAAPYFRVFNPILQSKKFDPNGDYIRKFVPELAHLTADKIQDPINPIVDRATVKPKVLAFFKRA